MEANYTIVREVYPDLFESELGLNEQEVIDQIHPRQFQERDSSYVQELKDRLEGLEKPGEHTIIGTDIVIRTK